uniref:Dynein light chain n=1 Tax=Leersia perrieri TaxID=77586 RepID=A0A0D9VHJ7_9ORYZ
MDPASEELEQRSRYLSSLIRRTKLHASPALAPPPPTPPPEPETKVEVRREPESAKASAAVVVEKREVKEGGGGGQAGRKGEPERAEEGAKKATAAVEKREVKDGGGKKGEEKGKEERKVSVRVRAADMPLGMQRRAVRLAYDAVAAMPRVDSKRLALALKKDFDTSYGPAWHCIVGTGFGSYVTHSVGGFLYFSIDKVYILLFRTAVEPLAHPQ